MRQTTFASAEPDAATAHTDAGTGDADRLRRSIRRLDRRLRRRGGGTDLSPSQFEVLTTIVRRGPIGLGDLAELEGLNPTMLSRIASKLEAAGLAGRMTDSHDGRAVQMVATEPGLAFFEQVRLERNEILRVALAELSPGQQSALLAAMPALEALAEALGDHPQ